MPRNSLGCSAACILAPATHPHRSRNRKHWLRNQMQSNQLATIVFGNSRAVGTRMWFDGMIQPTWCSQCNALQYGRFVLLGIRLWQSRRLRAPPLMINTPVPGQACRLAGKLVVPPGAALAVGSALLSTTHITSWKSATAPTCANSPASWPASPSVLKPSQRFSIAVVRSRLTKTWSRNFRVDEDSASQTFLQ